MTNRLKTKLKMKKILVNAGYKDYWVNEKFTNSLMSKEFLDFFSDRFDNVYNSMAKLGCFRKRG